MGCCSQGSTLEEAKYMITDVAKGWLDVKDVRLRFKIERENERNAELLVFNSPEAARRHLAQKRK